MDLIKKTVLENISKYPTDREYEGLENMFSQAILHEGKKKWNDISGNWGGRQDECAYQEIYTITQPAPNLTEYNISFTIDKKISVPSGCPTLKQTIVGLSGSSYYQNGRNYDSSDLVGINFTQQEHPARTTLKLSFWDGRHRERLIWKADNPQADQEIPELSEAFNSWNARYINPWFGFFDREGSFLDTWDKQSTRPVTSCTLKTVLENGELEPIDRGFIEKIYYGAPLPRPTAPLATTWFSHCNEKWLITTFFLKSADKGARHFQRFLQAIKENTR
ncbi:MAG: hypothetical protein IKS41_06735 [Alphaproteobacteria bacterium]|nr:hypothetical protein [Alphaproteobacteria bacterium]